MTTQQTLREVAQKLRSELQGIGAFQNGMIGVPAAGVIVHLEQLEAALASLPAQTDLQEAAQKQCEEIKAWMARQGVVGAMQHHHLLLQAHTLLKKVTSLPAQDGREAVGLTRFTVGDDPRLLFDALDGADVMLRIDGDFESPADLVQYRDTLHARLNAAAQPLPLLAQDAGVDRRHEFVEWCIQTRPLSLPINSRRHNNGQFIYGVEQEYQKWLATQAPQAVEDAPEPDMCWLSDDGERHAHDLNDMAHELADDLVEGEVGTFKLDCARRLPQRTIRVWWKRDDEGGVHTEWEEVKPAATPLQRMADDARAADERRDEFLFEAGRRNALLE